MGDKPSHSRTRIAVAQFMIANNIELSDLYACLGVEMSSCDAGALSHMAGVVDGMNVAATRIRQHGIDEWTKS